MTTTTNLRWKETLKGYNIILDDNIIGTIYNNWILLKTKAEINQNKYIFKNEFLFSNTINILERKTDERIGELVFSNWRTNARIAIGEKVTTWNYNIWKGKWNVKDFDGRKIKFSDGLLKKNITTDSDNHLLILIGLYSQVLGIKTAIRIILAITIILWIFTLIP